jgi:hypothetical protein
MCSKLNDKYIVDITSSNNEILGKTKEITDKTTSRLADGLRELMETKEQIDAINIEITGNNNKLERANHSVNETNSELSIANRQITSFIKNLFTDKLIIGFIVIIILVIILIVVFTTQKPIH